jgi:hypothetical protein
MEKNSVKGIPIFFILGRPRSGTTLLRTLFDAHPNVKIPPEFPIILPLYQKFRHVKDWDEKTINSFIDHIYQHPAFKNRTLENLKIDKEPYVAMLMSMVHTGTIQDFLKSFNYQSFSLFEKKEITRIGDKNPIYSIYATRFLKVFPEAKFICIIRDYRDNYISMKGLADLLLEAPNLILQVYRWRFVTRSFLNCRKKYPDRFHIIRYEDLVTDQEKAFREMCSFIGIPFEQSVFDFFKKKDESYKTYPKELVEKYHKSLMNPINTGRMEIYKKELSGRQIKTADQIAGKYADLMGYERKNKRFEPWTYLRTRPLVIYGYLIFRLMQAGTYLPYRLSWWLSLNLLILVRIYGKLTGLKNPKDQSKK